MDTIDPKNPPEWAPKAAVRDLIATTRFSLSARVLERLRREYGIRAITIAGRTQLHVAEALAAADSELKKAPPATTMKGGMDPAAMAARGRGAVL